MLSLIFWILMFMTFGKILKFALKMAWGISKIIVSLVLLPLFLVVLVLKGLMFLALPILVVVGVIALIALHD
ncbi:MAG: hypothetical protein IKK95_03930 [Lachnospiraceae bacterium]|nr:hypothetical protein [Lachnospiraceae bacterium]